MSYTGVSKRPTFGKPIIDCSDLAVQYCYKASNSTILWITNLLAMARFV